MATSLTATAGFASAGTRPGVAWSRIPAFDWLFVVLGGLPFVVPPVLLLGEVRLSGTDPIAWYVWMNTVVSAPHVYATYLRLGRKIAERRVSRLFGWPAYAACVGALGLASWSGHYVEAMTAVNVVQSFHYVRQVYGVGRFYGRDPAERPFERRLVFWAYHLAMPLFVIGRWHTLWVVWSGRPSPYIIPMRFPDLVLAACWALAAAGMIAGIAAEVARYRRGRTAYRAVGAVNLLAFYAVHAYGFLSIAHYQRGFFVVTIFHAVQYLALVWVLERDHATGFRQRLAAPVSGHPAFVLFWGGLLLFVLSLENALLPLGDRWWPYLSGVVLSAVSAHHYTVDAVMWRTRAGR